MIQTRSTTRAQTARLVNPTKNVTKQDSNQLAKNSNKVFRPPKARKTQDTSRIEEGCRKIDRLNSNKDQLTFDVPKCLP
jgi:hypothetical protein